MKTFVEYPPNSGIIINNFEGQMVGDYGKLLEVDGRVQCHCCGGWYRSLQAHVAMEHGLKADDYRAAFGLNYTQGLQCSELRQRKSEQSSLRYQLGMMPFIKGGNKPGATDKTRGRAQRRQAYMAMVKAHPKAFIDTHCIVCDGVFRTSAAHPRLTCSDRCRALRRVDDISQRGSQQAKQFWVSLNSNPEARSAFLMARAEARRGPTLEKTCLVCKKAFTVPEYRAALKTCGASTCVNALRSQTQRTQGSLAPQNLPDRSPHE